jgi:predicted phage baseplate assembly protein
MIPPRGAGNVRMTVYQTGGGSAGNRPAGVITQMKTTVPYVEKVVNPEQASGGTDAESVDMLYGRSPRSIRHRSRSVTVEDYQDVALLASPEVARALCVPLRNLYEDPMGDTITPGEVSVIIVPRTNSKKPLPGLELINRVQDYLMEHAAATANISVVGPLYLRVDAAVEIALVSLEGSGEVEMEVRRTLEKFLHPLTGGLVGKGWDFGREPYKSDLYAQIESVPGVDHVRSLTLDDSAEDPDGAIKETGRFLVYSGNHQISMLFE